jgi:hypothetical protein
MPEHPDFLPMRNFSRGPIAGFSRSNAARAAWCKAISANRAGAALPSSFMIDSLIIFDTATGRAEDRRQPYRRAIAALHATAVRPIVQIADLLGVRSVRRRKISYCRDFGYLGQHH